MPLSRFFSDVSLYAILSLGTGTQQVLSYIVQEKVWFDVIDQTVPADVLGLFIDEAVGRSSLGTWAMRLEASFTKADLMVFQESELGRKLAPFFRQALGGVANAFVLKLFIGWPEPKHHCLLRLTPPHCSGVLAGHLGPPTNESLLGPVHGRVDIVAFSKRGTPGGGLILHESHARPITIPFHQERHVAFSASLQYSMRPAGYGSAEDSPADAGFDWHAIVLEQGFLEGYAADKFKFSTRRRSANALLDRWLCQRRNGHFDIFQSTPNRGGGEAPSDSLTFAPAWTWKCSERHIHKNLVSSEICELMTECLRFPKSDEGRVMQYIYNTYHASRKDESDPGNFQVAKFFAQYFSPAVFGSHLDAGSGNCGLIKLMRREGYKSVGVELSALAVNRHCHGLEVAQGSLQAIPYPDASFDLLTAIEVLEHFPKQDIGGILKELRRVVRYFLVVTIADCAEDCTGVCQWPAIHRSGMCKRLPRIWWHQRFLAAGFQSVPEEYFEAYEAFFDVWSVKHKLQLANSGANIVNKNPKLRWNRRGHNWFFYWVGTWPNQTEVWPEKKLLMAALTKAREDYKVYIDSFRAMVRKSADAYPHCWLPNGLFNLACKMIADRAKVNGIGV